MPKTQGLILSSAKEGGASSQGHRLFMECLCSMCEALVPQYSKERGSGAGKDGGTKGDNRLTSSIERQLLDYNPKKEHSLEP